MENPILSCGICGITSETKIIKWCSKTQCYLCSKHKGQIYRNGKITDSSSRTTNDGNEFIYYDDYAEIILRDSKQIETGRAIIDLENVEKCRKIKWAIGSKGYVTSKSNRLFLHRFLMDYYGPLQIDHINRNKLDNRKMNLRIVSGFINNQNNGAIGVSFDKNANKWKAEFQRFGKYFNVGTFNTKEEAIEARIKAINEAEKNADNLLLEYEEKNCNRSIGVRPSPHGRWVAKFYRQNKTYHVGTFDTQEEAIAARLEAVKNFEARKKAV